MNLPKSRQLPLTAAVLLSCFGAQAAYQSPDGDFTLSGFGTLGAARSSTDEAQFVYPGQGGGATKHFNISTDSKVAVQGTYKLTPTVSATTQVMSKYDSQGQYTPNFEWAFAKWQAGPGLSVRAGRMGAPFFMISDFRDVGFANTTVRPNLDVYGQVPVSFFDGGDIAYQANMGAASLTSTLWAGDARAKYALALRSAGSSVEPSEVVLHNMIGLNVQADLDNGLSLRVGHMQGKLTVSSPSIAAVVGYAHGVANAGAASTSAADALDSALIVNGTSASFSGMGLTYDQNDIVFSAEYTKRKVTKGNVPDTTGWYALAGYRLGSVLPYVSISRLTVDDPNAALPDLSSFAAAAANISLPAILRQAAGGVYVGAPAMLNTQKLSQRTVSAGARWDVQSGLALKAQIDHVSVPKDSNGLFLITDPLAASQGGSVFLNREKDINVLTFSVDFVF